MVDGKGGEIDYASCLRMTSSYNTGTCVEAFNGGGADLNDEMTGRGVRFFLYFQ